MVLSNCGHSHEYEDKGLADATQHLHEILYCSVGFLRNVLLHVFIHCHGTRCNPAGVNYVSFSFFICSFQLTFQSLKYLQKIPDIHTQDKDCVDLLKFLFQTIRLLYLTTLSNLFFFK